MAGTGDGGACSGDDVGDTSDRSKSPPSHPFCIKLLCEYEGVSIAIRNFHSPQNLLTICCITLLLIGSH